MVRANRPAVDPTAYDQHEAAIAVIMNLVFVRHFIDIYRAFGGDLVEAIVLGEVAHHNVAAMRTSDTDVHSLSRRLAGHGPPRDTLLPTNAYSIAEASGIPRETVRRKVKSLERRGWIARDAAGNLYVTTRPQAHFTALNRTRCAELLEAARAIETLLGSRAGAARVRKSHGSGSRTAHRRRSGTER